MTREELIVSARKLVQPSQKAVSEYARHRETMASDINRLMRGRADIDYMVGGNLSMMEDNHRNHARFMESLLGFYTPEVLVDTVLWVFRAYRAHGFQLTYWPAQLDTWVEVLRNHLSDESFQEIYPFYHWMIVNQAAFAALSDSFLEGKLPDFGGKAAHDVRC